MTGALPPRDDAPSVGSQGRIPHGGVGSASLCKHWPFGLMNHLSRRGYRNKNLCGEVYPEYNVLC